MRVPIHASKRPQAVPSEHGENGDHGNHVVQANAGKAQMDINLEDRQRRNIEKDGQARESIEEKKQDSNEEDAQGTDNGQQILKPKR